MKYLTKNEEKKTLVKTLKRFSMIALRGAACYYFLEGISSVNSKKDVTPGSLRIASALMTIEIGYRLSKYKDKR